jgi:hypothetical protein
VKIIICLNSFDSIPSSGDLWNVYVNIKTGRLDLWDGLVPTFSYNSNFPFFETTVPTTETVRMGYIMERLLAVNHPVLFTGLTGRRATLSYAYLRALRIVAAAFHWATIINLLQIHKLMLVLRPVWSGITLLA